MEVTIKEAKTHMSALLDRSQKGEDVVIVRRGKRIAKLVPLGGTQQSLPDLQDFRKSIAVKGKSLSSEVVQGRNEERY